MAAHARGGGNAGRRHALAVVAVLSLPCSATGATVPLEGSLRYSDTGRPATGLGVRLGLRGQYQGEEHLAWNAATDAGGRFHFPSVPAQRTFVLSVWGPAYPLFQLVELVATGHTPRRLPPITVPPAVPRSGVALLEDGRPAEGARVTLHQRRFLRPPSPGRRSRLRSRCRGRTPGGSDSASREERTTAAAPRKSGRPMRRAGSPSRSPTAATASLR